MKLGPQKSREVPSYSIPSQIPNPELLPELLLSSLLLTVLLLRYQSILVSCSSTILMQFLFCFVLGICWNLNGYRNRKVNGTDGGPKFWFWKSSVFMQFMDSRITDCARVLLENLAFVDRVTCYVIILLEIDGFEKLSLVSLE